MPPTDHASHEAQWNAVYATKAADAVSWYRPHLSMSIQMLVLAGLTSTSRVIDVGAGASTLVDDLLDRGVTDITALDLAGASLEVARRRLRERAARVRWLVADVTEAEFPPASFDVWHDRAALHFLTDPLDILHYVDIATRALADRGHLIVAGFAPDGPEQCSGLPVVRRSAEALVELFGRDFDRVHAEREVHTTPWGSPQAFTYVLLRRRPRP